MCKHHIPKKPKKKKKTYVLNDWNHSVYFGLRGLYRFIFQNFLKNVWPTEFGIKKIAVAIKKTIAPKGLQILKAYLKE